MRRIVHITNLRIVKLCSDHPGLLCITAFGVTQQLGGVIVTVPARVPKGLVVAVSSGGDSDRSEPINGRLLLKRLASSGSEKTTGLDPQKHSVLVDSMWDMIVRIDLNG